jgi:hypothetical protein
MPRGSYIPENVISTDVPPGEVVDFNPTNFDEVTAGHGVLLEHYIGIRCPAGLVDKTDSLHRPHPDHEGCSNGFIYKSAGLVMATFAGVGKDVRQVDLGILDPSTSNVTFTRSYTDGRQVFMSPMDRFFLAEESILVPNWDVVEASPIGLDRLLFPAAVVTHVVDSRGLWYQVGKDYQLTNGQIQWLQGHGPGMDPQSGKGRIFTARYLYRPYWYLQRMLHEIRPVQTMDNDGNRRIQQANQAAVLQREYVYVNEDGDDMSITNSASLRQAPRPPSGGIPSR